MNKSFFYFASLLLFGLCTSVPTMAKEIAVLLDPNIKPYVNALAGFEANTSATLHIFERKENGSFADERALINNIRRRKPDHILALGDEALRAIAGKITDIPIVFCMVLNPNAELLQDVKNLTGVSMTVPPEQPMSLLVKLVPSTKDVGTVYNPEHMIALIKEGKIALAKQNVRLHTETASTPREALRKAQLLEDKIDAFWMMPDQSITGIELAKYLFFQASKNSMPLIGISDRYVRAGALFAYSVEGTSLGQQAARISQRILDGESIARIKTEPARLVQLSINTKVAAKLGVEVPPEILRQANNVY